METINVHISTIRQGDTIVHNGEVKTVAGNNIQCYSFMGVTLFGDSYKMGYQKVIKVSQLGCMKV